MIKSIHSRTFGDVWQALYHATSPGPAVNRWQHDGVDWVRETYRASTRDYSFHIEAHVLTHAGTARSSWSLLVAIERWWTSDRGDALKSSLSRQVLKGNNKQIINWFDRQRALLEAPAAHRHSIGGNDPADDAENTTIRRRLTK